MRKKVIVALGGNALGNNPKEQVTKIKKTAKSIVELIKNGYDVVITHGNGPQIGMINLAFDFSHKEKETPIVPFPECGAMSQGYIGYHLQQAITEELMKNNMRKSCLTVITQILVDKNDEAFKNPDKPIGDFYTKEEAEKIEKETGYIFKEDAGRGYRRVVPSPKPIKILELKVIKSLVSKGNIVITCGGGGIPVIEDNNGFKGIDAVIDKDISSAKLAITLKADILLILTNVEQVSINYKKENEEKLKEITIAQAKEYIKNNEFAKGSMLPKVLACTEFIKKRKDGIAIITSLEKAALALEGKTGTRIIKGGKNNGK